MDWIDDYQLFLFDFDGLLVNTEEIHFQAYTNMCLARGFTLGWDFKRYCQSAHYDSEALRKDIYAHLPKLYALEPDWRVLYKEKQQAVIKLFQEGAVQLMPGVERILRVLEKAQVKRCVVTHSAEELITTLRRQHPILDSIPFWITRKDYSLPKPDPECYLKAIKQYAQEFDQVIGFEDSPRGLKALLGTRAKAVLISQISYPEIPQFLNQGAVHFTSLDLFQD